MKRRAFNRCILSALLAGAALAAGPAAQAQNFPNRAIEIVVPFAAGGGTDAMARAMGDASRTHLPQPIVVLNKPGAAGGIGLTEVANAKPDGYKLALVTADMVIIPHLGLTKTTYEKFTPIIQLNADPSAITVAADSPYNTIEAFLDAARAKPESMQVGNAGIGSIWHLAAAALEDKTGAKFNHIPFNGGNPAVLALLGGHIDAVAVSPAEVMQYVKAGKLKPLAVMADARVAGFENVPTLKERNIDLSIGTWRGIAAPKGTPQPVLDTLSAAFRQAAAENSLKRFMAEQNLGYAVADQQTFTALMERDNATFKNLIEKFGMRQ
ncbi:tripartite tricarboxylate transporter substrate binding protein [Achromobacter insolitus]|uniref:tripartite tricarboxylate transporter substrate binding protein n=1 Tax=Achromobacter TaxID=222 RepID=UPI0005383CDB|nr:MULTISPECIES: tripartite tricarboxylate transporter substrate binding protein [Achromobacter]GLK93439.1 ABC transporter substrate-binding protein [Achromobacter xylosoxidans]AVG39470.1 tripartite tricarboxylate transporter substrate binding protein [Achromobacter insolitus]AXA70156.1 tripartite tricarboxylate transporter substrate binding protein [Achromobacter insolitus]MCP1403197.1 tripartite-type tricarboxylate transporter receptor subunit TctC [Achromobacter insolitus]MDH3064527.1 tripa